MFFAPIKKHADAAHLRFPQAQQAKGCRTRLLLFVSGYRSAKLCMILLRICCPESMQKKLCGTRHIMILSPRMGRSTGRALRQVSKVISTHSLRLGSLANDGLVGCWFLGPTREATTVTIINLVFVTECNRCEFRGETGGQLTPMSESASL
jgi:hypothetical protein